MQPSPFLQRLNIYAWRVPEVVAILQPTREIRVPQTALAPELGVNLIPPLIRLYPFLPRFQANILGSHIPEPIQAWKFLRTLSNFKIFLGQQKTFPAEKAPRFHPNGLLCDDSGQTDPDFFRVQSLRIIRHRRTFQVIIGAHNEESAFASY
jgi:hypothetical protein